MMAIRRIWRLYPNPEWHGALRFAFHTASLGTIGVLVPGVWGLVFVCCLAGSPSASLLRRRKSRRVPPSGPRLRRPAKEGPRRAAVHLLPYGPGRAASGGFRFAILSQRKRLAMPLQT